MPDNDMSQTEAPWYAAYPAAESTAAPISRSEVQLWLHCSMDSDLRDFVLVDLRRNDHEGGTIKGSINLPAQSLYPTIPTLFAIFSAANIKKVVWYCGSSRGRGTRAASWFADYLKERGEESKGMESLFLEGGIKGWACAGENYVKLMDEYEPAYWDK